jgi:hypothetical protein
MYYLLLVSWMNGVQLPVRTVGFLFHHPQLPVQWVLGALGLLGSYSEFLVLNIHAVINLQFNILVLFLLFQKKSVTLNQLPQGRTKKQTSVWKIFGLGKQKEE